jgi:hypothetical protein
LVVGEKHPLTIWCRRRILGVPSVPHRWYLVLSQEPVGGDDHQIVYKCLCDEQSVERIAVVWREGSDRIGVTNSDRKLEEAIVAQQRLVYS